MSKRTPLSVQNDLTSKIHGFHDRAQATKDAYYQARRDTLANDRLSPAAQHDDLTALADKVAETLKGIRGEQDRYVDGLKATLAKELAGNQPMDANSIMLRRDASDRARKLDTERDALAALQDAVNDGDESMAHAIGTRARNNGWVNVAEAWQAAHPETAGSAEALDYVESYTGSGAYNLANGAAYATPMQ